MPSPKRKKSSPKVPYKEAHTRSKVQKATPKQKVTKATRKINNPKNPEKPTDKTLSHLFKTYHWDKFDTTIRRIPDPQEIGEQAFRSFIPYSVARLLVLSRFRGQVGKTRSPL
jgi:hypothetical protein